MFQLILIILMSDFGRNILKTSETWSSDGTLSTVLRDFSQIYVVFGSSHDKLFPCATAYMLLPNKTASVYEYALNLETGAAVHSSHNKH